MAGHQPKVARFARCGLRFSRRCRAAKRLRPFEIGWKLTVYHSRVSKNLCKRSPVTIRRTHAEEDRQACGRAARDQSRVDRRVTEARSRTGGCKVTAAATHQGGGRTGASG